MYLCLNTVTTGELIWRTTDENACTILGMYQRHGLHDWHLHPNDTSKNLAMEFCRHLLHLPGNAWSVRLKYLLFCEAAVIFPFDAHGGWEEFWTHLLQVI